MPTITSTSTVRRAIEYDDSRHPLVVITFRGTATPEEFDAYLELTSRGVDRRQRHAVIVDVTESGVPSALERKKQSEWQLRNHDVLEAYTVGETYVVTSPIIRGVLTALFWIAPRPYPHHFASTLAEGERWATEQLRAAGLHAPPARAPR